MLQNTKECAVKRRHAKDQGIIVVLHTLNIIFYPCQGIANRDSITNVPVRTAATVGPRIEQPA